MPGWLQVRGEAGGWGGCEGRSVGEAARKGWELGVVQEAGTGPPNQKG